MVYKVVLLDVLDHFVNIKKVLRTLLHILYWISKSYGMKSLLLDTHGVTSLLFCRRGVGRGEGGLMTIITIIMRPIPTRGGGDILNRGGRMKRLEIGWWMGCRGHTQ